MQCSNCKGEFPKYQKSYRRTALLSQTRSESVLKDVLEVEITPKLKKEERFLCTECEKLLKTATSGHQAKHELFAKTSEGTYMHRKRKALLQFHTPAKKRIIASSTPLTQKHPRKMTTGARYFASYRYKQGFKYFLNKSGAALKALRSVLSKKTRLDMRDLLKSRELPNMSKVSLKSFMEMDFNKMIKKVKMKVPFLYDAVTSAMTNSQSNRQSLLRGSSQMSIVPVLGTILAMITSQARPKHASLLQKMNAVQMWRSGCKRSLFNAFNKLGICVSEGTMLSALDTLRTAFDEELMTWKSELQRYVFPNNGESSDESELQQGSDEIDSLGSISAVETSSTASSYTSSDSFISENGSDEEWEDVYDEEEMQADEADLTIPFGDPSVPKGYTICWDNVGKQVKARRQTRNHGNKYKNWAMAYAIKNRICTTHFTDHRTIPAVDIDLETYILNKSEKHQVRERLINMVQRIMVKYLTIFKTVQQVPAEYFPHMYDKESCEKTEMFNIGIIDENPSSTNGVIKILEKLHKYVPTSEDGKPHTLLTWGDGLSCERHVDAQNARANAESDILKLKGLEPAAQDFHRRMLMLQDLMNKLYDGKSAKDKGTLYYLKNLFNQRSVSGNVSETFNYVADFIKFVTESYVLLFAMDIMDLDAIDNDHDIDDSEEVLNTVSEQIVDLVWCDIDFEKSTVDQKHCFCEQNTDDDEDPMIQCDNQECEGEWFHMECVGLDEDNLPDEWYCSEKCKKAATQNCFCKRNIKDEDMIECCNINCRNGSWFHAICVGLERKLLPKEDETWYCSQECKKHSRGTDGVQKVDRKFEYTKLLVWGGLNDRIRREAVRYNDGQMITTLWKMDLPQLFLRNHTKYFVLAHRLITALNGFVPERLKQDLKWNRTVNIRGGRGRNDEADLVNEFLNREFKESIRAVGSKTTDKTLERHGKLAGGVGKVLDDVFSSVTEAEKSKPAKRIEDSRLEDVKLFIRLLKDEKLTQRIPGRSHKSFPKMNSNATINFDKFKNRVRSLSKRLDKAKRVAL